MYDFKLITILVLDDFGEGIPVAWAISNREDAIMLVEFLGAIKYRTGPLKPPRWFMSDDAEQYYNSWKSVFGVEGTTKLFCAWHVDRSWRNALKEHVHTAEARLELYHHLRVLLMERVMLQQLLSYLDNEEKDFLCLFQSYLLQSFRAVGIMLSCWHSCKHQHVSGVLS